MRLPIFRKSAAETPSEKEDIQSLRETIISRLLWSAVVLGVPAILLAIQPSVAKNLWGSVFFYVSAYILVLLAAIFQDRLPSWVKIAGLIIPVYALGVLNLVNNGLMKDGIAFLLAFVTLAGALLGIRAGLVTLGVSLATYIFIGWAVTSKTIALLSSSLDPINPKEWLSTGGVFTLLGFVVVLAITSMTQGLESGLQQRSRLAGDLERDRELLKGRSQDLQRRLTQLRTAAEISRRFSTVMEPQTLLQQATDLLAERLDLYFVGIFLVETEDAGQGQSARLRAGSGEAGKKLIADEYQVLIGGSSLVSHAITDRKPRLSNEISKEEFRAVNPFLPLTRSEAALPLVVGQRILGAMSMQSARNNAFDSDDVAILQGIAETIANTLENDRLFQKLQTTLDEIQRLNEQYINRSWAYATKETPLHFTYQPDPAGQNAPPQPNALPEKLEIPLVLRQQTIGSIKLEGADQTKWSDEQKAFVRAVAIQATQALENARLIKETQRRAARQQFVADFARTVRASTDVETILRTSLRELAQSLQASEATIQLKFPTGQAKLSDVPDEARADEARIEPAADGQKG